MKTGYLVAAFAALVSGAALNAQMIKRDHTPATIMSGYCKLRPDFMDGGFAGNGSDWGIETTDEAIGTLRYTSGFGGNFGAKADSGNKGAFHFRVLNGSGAFYLYQYVCAEPYKAYGLRWYVGMSSPMVARYKGGGGSSTGCSLRLMVNGDPINAPRPVCGSKAFAPVSYGDCTKSSYDNSTRYMQDSTLWRPRQPVNKIAFKFICSANSTMDYNAQVNLDYVFDIPEKGPW